MGIYEVLWGFMGKHVQHKSARHCFLDTHVKRPRVAEQRVLNDEHCSRSRAGQFIIAVAPLNISGCVHNG